MLLHCKFLSFLSANPSLDPLLTNSLQGLDMNRGVFLCPICGKEPHVSYGFDNILAAVEEEQAQLERDAQVQRDAQAARAAQIEREAQAERETQAQRHTAAQRDNPAQRNSRAQRGSQAQRDKTFRQMRG